MEDIKSSEAFDAYRGKSEVDGNELNANQRLVRLALVVSRSRTRVHPERRPFTLPPILARVSPMVSLRSRAIEFRSRVENYSFERWLVPAASPQDDSVVPSVTSTQEFTHAFTPMETSGTLTRL